MSDGVLFTTYRLNTRKLKKLDHLTLKIIKKKLNE